MVQKDPETGTESKQEDSFTSTLETFKVICFSSFIVFVNLNLIRMFLKM